MTRAGKVRVTVPQYKFLSMPNKYRAFVAGFGSGKTYAGCLGRCIHHLEHGRINSGYFAPSYPHIRDIFYPTIEEVASFFDITVKIRQANHEVHYFRAGRQIGTTICRSLDNPGRIIGFKIGDAMIDEFDTLPIDKALLAWRKIQARMRFKVDGVANRIDVTTTPEGFLATHKLFVADPSEKPELKENYGIVHASTYDNADNLPSDYIQSLVESYPAELIEAYLNGKFVNLRSGTVYRAYKRDVHHSNETIQEKEPLHIGMDFNVQHMAACVFVNRQNGWHAVAELKDVFDTPEMIRIIKEKWKAKNHRIIVYPDATGSNRKSSDASTSDIAMLNQARFEVRVNPSNPAVKDRINAVNKQFQVSNLWVNSKECKTIASCLEKQVYDKNGEPDKTSGFDHQNDAFGYPVAYEFPINKPVIYTGIGSAR